MSRLEHSSAYLSPVGVRGWQPALGLVALTTLTLSITENIHEVQEVGAEKA